MGAKTVGLGFLSGHSRVERNEHPHIYCFNISYPLVSLDSPKGREKIPKCIHACYDLGVGVTSLPRGWPLQDRPGSCGGLSMGAGAYYTPDGSGGGRLLVGRRMSKNARCSFPAFSISR